MVTPKRISAAGVERALEKAERYRLLHEPSDAESICLDILEVAPDHQRALTVLLLARSDQFESGRGARIDAAREVLPRLASDYERKYYAGIICERWAKALHARGAPGSGQAAYPYLHEAMAWYERAEAVRPVANDDALLRWNACARLLARHPEIRPAAAAEAEVMLE
jgi:hypothetical protein